MCEQVLELLELERAGESASDAIVVGSSSPSDAAPVACVSLGVAFGRVDDGAYERCVFCPGTCVFCFAFGTIASVETIELGS